jgi:hypothetical protein
MRRVAVAWFVIIVLAALVGLDLSAQRATVPRFWFCPGPGTLDYIRLFDTPPAWSHARQLVSVFKFYQQHTVMPADPIVGPNTYDALARAGVFRQLNQWRIQTAIEVGAVKEFYCTPDARGMNEAIAATLASVRAIETAGGSVSYLSMDDPFAAGLAPVCGGPAPEPSADRIATYSRGVRAALPSVRIGWIEAYPLSSADAIESMMGLLAARGALPAFLHMDVDMPFLVRRGRTDDFVRDMKRLRNAASARGMQFGIIIWGNNGDADALYALDAERILESLTATFPTSDNMPDHVVVQSWAESSTGLRITPTNLPEDQLYTHTNLLWNAFRRLRGQTAPASGVAVGRR